MAARAKDPAYGATLPDFKVFSGVRKVYFDGYGLDDKGRPTFRYRVKAAEGNVALSVEETPEPVKTAVGTGLVRRIAATGGGQAAWLLAGECKGARPTLYDPKTKKATVADAKKPPPAEPAGSWVVMPQDGERVIVYTLEGAPEGTEWHVEPKGTAGEWQALVKLPGGKEGVKAKFGLGMHPLSKADPTLLAGLEGK